MTPVKIPLAKPCFNSREVEAVRRVLDNGWVIQGPEVEAFEKAVAEMHQVRHCVAVTSGTAALHVCYLALGIGSGDAVFVPSFAWPSAANMAVIIGARPVFVDVLPGTYNIDPEDLRSKIEVCIKQGWGALRALVPVHEFGLAVDMECILEVAREFQLDVIEDAACALGASYKGKPVGSLGKMGVFSFHPRKAVTTGEGGAIVTDDPELAERCRMLRNHGQVAREGKRDLYAAGLNYRMTDIQAAIGRVQLEKFPAILKKRREIAGQYLYELSECSGLDLPENNPEHTWQTFMVVLDDWFDRVEVAGELAARGIGSGPGSISGHCAHVYKSRFGYRPGDLPVSDRLNRQGLALPLYADLSDEEVQQCAKNIREVCWQEKP